MKRFLTRHAFPFSLYYGPDGDAEGTTTEGGTTEGTTTESTTNESTTTETTPAPTVDDPNNKLKFTAEQQKFINQKMAEEKRKQKAETEKTIKELEKLKQNQALTTKQKDELQVRIEELQQQFMTKEELLRKEREKREKEYKSELEKHISEKDEWRNRYTNSTIERALTDGAAKHDAFSADQIVAILKPNTKLVETVDAENKPTGEYEPRIKFSDIDAEGKNITLDLSVNEAVKRMKDLPERFGNLFKSGVAGGLGQNGSTQSKKKVDPKNMNTAQYMEARKKDKHLNFTGTK
jgi:hypothetical protein